MSKIIDRKIRPLIQSFGFDIVRFRDYPIDFCEQNIKIYESVKLYTMTSPEKVKALDEYISDKNIRILLNRIDYAGRIAIKT